MGWAGCQNEKLLDPAFVMMRIAEAVPANGIVVDEGLTSTSTLRSFLPYRDRGSDYGMVSGGIGWGVAGAVGVQLARPDRPVLAESLGMPARRITEADEVGAAVEESMASGRPSLLNVVMDGSV